MLIVGPYLLLNSCMRPFAEGVFRVCVRHRGIYFEYLYIYNILNVMSHVFNKYLSHMGFWAWNYVKKYHILMAKGFRECIGCCLWSLRFSFSPFLPPFPASWASQDLISTISASVSNANAAISACQRQWRQAFGTSVENLYLTFVDSDIRHRI